MKLRKSCFGMDYEMESLIQALVIQINLIWNQFHGIIHELIRYAHALLHTSDHSDTTEHPALPRTEEGLHISTIGNGQKMRRRRCLVNEKMAA